MLLAGSTGSSMHPEGMTMAQGSTPVLIGMSFLALIGYGPTSAFRPAQLISPTQEVSSAYDGQWVADVPQEDNCPAARIEIEVRSGVIRGTVTESTGTFPVKGRINENGSGAMILHRAFNKNAFAGVVRFSANQFDVDYDPCATRHAIGHRAGSTT
jgi:hypothetical protein